MAFGAPDGRVAQHPEVEIDPTHGLMGGRRDVGARVVGGGHGARGAGALDERRELVHAARPVRAAVDLLQQTEGGPMLGQHGGDARPGPLLVGGGHVAGRPTVVEEVVLAGAAVLEVPAQDVEGRPDRQRRRWAPAGHPKVFGRSRAVLLEERPCRPPNRYHRPPSAPRSA